MEPKKKEVHAVLRLKVTKEAPNGPEAARLPLEAAALPPASPATQT